VKDKEQVSFWKKKFKIETEFELKFLKEKLLLNLGQIYWGPNQFGKI
jgi:hypothetical protein